MTKGKKILLFASLGLLCVGGIGTGVGLSISAYERQQTVKDNLGDELSISADGLRKTTYYLDIGVWSSLTSCNFYGLFFLNNDHSTFEYVNGTLEGSNYKYELDTVPYDRVQFCVIPVANGTPSLFDHRNREDSEPGKSTDLTYELSFVSGKNTYQITQWHDYGISFEATGYWR